MTLVIGTDRNTDSGYAMVNVGEDICNDCTSTFNFCSCNAQVIRDEDIFSWFSFTDSLLDEPYEILFFDVLPYAVGYSNEDAIDKYYLHDTETGRSARKVLDAGFEIIENS